MSFNIVKGSGRHLIMGVVVGAVLLVMAGCSANSDGSNNGNNGTGTISLLEANPSTIPATASQKTTTLTWNHPEAASCTASSTDPSGNPLTAAGSFTGDQQTVNGIFTTPAQTLVGTYTYKLTCKNSSSGATTVDTATVAIFSGNVSTTSLTASPSSIALGATANTSTLTWNHPEASSCTATSTDPSGTALTAAGSFMGTQSPTNGSFVTPAQSTIGTYTYKLMCTNTSGTTTDTATVTVYQPATDVPLTAQPNTTTVGSSVSLFWNHPTATSCTAGETDPQGNPVTDFTGTKATQNGQFTTQALSVVGNYTFKLTCDGTPETATVIVKPINNVTADNCGVGLSNSVPLVNTTLADTTFTTTHKGLLPSIPALLPNGSDPMTNEANVINSDLTDFGTLTNFLGITGTVSEAVNDTGSTNLPYQGGRIAGFVVDFPPELVQAGVLQSVTLNTLKRNSFGDEQVVESADSTGAAGGGLKLQLLDTGVLGSTGTNKMFLSFPTTAGNNFDAVQMQIGGLLNVDNQINIYYACVADAPPVQ